MNSWMNEPEQPDLVDIFYAPFIRALGNLVIIYAQAEAALIKFLTALLGCEKAAHDLMKCQDCKDQVLALISKSIFTGFSLSELIAGVEKFWSDKETRNRLMHDEWYVAIEEGPTAVPSTRGIPRKKQSNVVWAHPTPLDLWKLAYSFQKKQTAFFPFSI
jgi:hypothetical protein